MSEFRTVCRVSDLVENIGRVVYVNEHPIAVFRIEGCYYAIDDTCPHMGASLAAGFVEKRDRDVPLAFLAVSVGRWKMGR
jgi:nitrite reductase (NADH) small subunit